MRRQAADAAFSGGPLQPLPFPASGRFDSAPPHHRETARARGHPGGKRKSVVASSSRKGCRSCCASKTRSTAASGRCHRQWQKNERGSFPTILSTYSHSAGKFARPPATDKRVNDRRAPTGPAGRRQERRSTWKRSSKFILQIPMVVVIKCTFSFGRRTPSRPSIS